MISNFFIRRPIVAMVIAILTVIVGLIAMLGLLGTVPRDLATANHRFDELYGRRRGND